MDKIDLSTLTTTGITCAGGLLALACVVVGWVALIFAYRGVLTLLRKTPNVSEGTAAAAAAAAAVVVARVE